MRILFFSLILCHSIFAQSFDAGFPMDYSTDFSDEEESPKTADSSAQQSSAPQETPVSEPPQDTISEFTKVLQPWEAAAVPVMQDDELINTPDPDSIPATSPEADKDSTAGAALKAQGAQGVKGVKGAVRGVVLDRDKQTPLQGVTVIYSSGAKVYRSVTSGEGLYGFGVLEPGAYEVEMSKKGYNPFKKNVTLGTGGEVREVRLEKRIPVARMIEVKQPRKQGSAMDLRKKRQKSSGVVEGMSAEQIAKSTDSDAGALARRVTGTSLVGGRYVFVRGLGERYTNMTFNGLPISSPEKDKRVVPQDLFPASALEAFTISKTFTPELQPDFAGGSIGLVTRGVPSKDVDKVSYGVGARDFLGDDQFTILGKNMMTYEGSQTDYFGYDGGIRARPEGVPTVISRFEQTREEIAAYPYAFTNIWAVDSQRVLPSQSIGYTHARVFKKDSVSKQGYLASISFKNSYNQINYNQVRFVPGSVKDADGFVVRDTVVTISEQTDEDGNTFLDTNVSRPPLQYIQRGVNEEVFEGTYNSTISGMLNYGWNNRNNKIWVKNFFANIAQNRTRNLQATRNPESSSSNEDFEDRFQLQFSRRHLLTNQIGGGHYIGWNVLDSMSWAAGYTWTQGEIPDMREYMFTKNYQVVTPQNDTTINGQNYAGGEQAFVLSKAHTYVTNAPYATRSWEEFGEYNVSGRSDLYLHFPPEMYPNIQYFTDTTKYKVFSHWELPSAQTGFLTQYKEKSFDLVRYDYQRNGASAVDTNGSYDLVEQFHDPNNVSQFILDNGNGLRTTPKDYDTFNSSEAQFGYYMQTHFGFRVFDVLTGIHLGGRYEYYQLDFAAPFTGSGTVPAEDSVRTINQKDHIFYPSFSMDMEFFPKSKTRFIYSRTRVRPEIRERAPTVFFDTDLGVEVVGNPDLEDIEISHYDVRFDYDFGKNQFFSFSLFYKDFAKPIESVLNTNAVPALLELQNANGAIAYGFETEVDFKLNSIIPGEQVDKTFLKDLSLYVNYAWIRSEVELDTSKSGVSRLTSQKRPMIGQSPYLFNSKLTHEVNFKNKRTMLNSLLFNVVGPRIELLGADGTPDIYRDPFPSLDYIHKLTLNKHTIALQLKNLLYSEDIRRGSEFNDTKEYETLTNAERDELYSQYEKNVLMRRQVGLTLGLSYSYNFQ